MNTSFKRWALALSALAMSIGVGLKLYGGGYLIKAVLVSASRGSTKAGPYDHLLFPGRQIKATHPNPWPVHPLYNQHKLSPALEGMLNQTGALALVVIKDGQILHESYWNGHGPHSISNSFSMAKPVVGMLLGFAVDEQRVHSLHDPVSNYLPGYSEGLAAKLQVVDLIRMTSGMAWDDPETYDNPLSKMARMYYNGDMTGWANAQPIVTEPGKHFHYNSANTVLASEVLAKATGQSLSAYLQQKVWDPLGMEDDAIWMLDHAGGPERAYCCLSASARDFARLGQFVMDLGKWGGRQLISKQFLTDALAESSPNYGYGFRMDHAHQPAFSMFRGLYGQMIIMVPGSNLVIVKLSRTALPDDPSRPLARAPESYLLVDEVVHTMTGAAR